MIHILLDCVSVHGLFLSVANRSENTDENKQSNESNCLEHSELLKMRELIIKMLRDSDVCVRYLAVEGTQRMLISDTCDKSRDFIARLILM